MLNAYQISHIAYYGYPLDSSYLTTWGYLQFATKEPDATAITIDDYFSRNQPSKPEELVNSVRVTTHPLAPASLLEEVYESEGIEITAGNNYSLTAIYDDPPVLVEGAVASVIENEGGSIQISSATYYAWGVEILLLNASSETGVCKVKIDGYPLTVQGGSTAVREDEQSIIENGLLEYEYPENHLLQSASIAAQIANTLLASYKQPRKDVTVSWRGNPAYELGDEITITQYHRGSTVVYGNFKIYKQTTEFDGGLRQTTDGRKV